MKAKFRIWDTQEKKMVFEGFHVFGEVTLFDAIGQYVFETKGSKSTLERYNDLVEMQFTGWTDKNGKDIYDGDVCKGPNGKLWVIEWMGYSWAMSNKMFPNGPMKFGGEETYTIDKWLMLSPRNQSVEVIGTIYTTHPELIG